MSLANTLQSLLDQAVNQGVAAGAVAAATNADTTLCCQAAGLRRADQPAAMSTDTVVWIASMTKAITAVAAMQLVERGLLQLDQPIGETVPELAQPQVLLGMAPDGTPQTRPARRAITLRHLLTHTSGLGYAFCSDLLLDYTRRTGVPDSLGGEKAAFTLPLLFDPGERWQYGVGIDWVGYAIERVCGQRLEAVLVDSLLGPLGMDSTRFRLNPDMRQRLAAMHGRNAQGQLVALDHEMPQDPEFSLAGGGLYSTAGDYLRFIRMLLQQGQLDGHRVLRPETVQEMLRNQVGELPCGQLNSSRPAASNHYLPCPPDQARWGLACLINLQPTPEGRSAHSQAWAGLSNCYYWLDPQRQLGGLLLTQLRPFADAGVLDLFRAVESAVYRAA